MGKNLFGQSAQTAGNCPTLVFKKASGSTVKNKETLKKVGRRAISTDAAKVVPSTSTANVAPLTNFGRKTVPVVHNTFDILSEHDDMDEIIVKPPEKKEKVSPIIIKSKNVGFIQDLIKSVVPSGKFSLKILSIGLKLEAAFIDDFNKVKSALLREGLEFFFYHTPATRPIKIMLKGLPSLSIAEVVHLLNEHNVHPDNVKVLSLDKLHRCHYILYFQPNSIKLNELRRITCLGYLKVSWEYFRSRRTNNVVQCRNCQLFGHNSINCSMNPKCLVCSKDHQTDSCPSRIPREELKQRKQRGEVDCSFIKCINCAAAGLKSDHTANWKNCPKRLEYMEIQKRVVLKNPTNKSSRNFSWNQEEFPALPSLNNGFSRVAASQSCAAPNYAQTSVPVHNTDLFSVHELQTIWQELFQKLRGCRSKEDQLMTLGNIVIKHLYSTP